jgi:hypothetical protein
MKLTVLAGAVATGVLIAACGTSAPESSSTSSDEALSGFGAANVVGTIAYGQTIGPVSYVKSQRYLGWRFRGNAGDNVTGTVASTTGGYPRLWLLSSTFATVDTGKYTSGSTTTTTLKRILPATGTYYLAFRDVNGASGSFDVSLLGPAHATDAGSAPGADSGPSDGAYGASCAGGQACAAGLACDGATRTCLVAQGGVCISVTSSGTSAPKECANGVGCVSGQESYDPSYYCTGAAGGYGTSCAAGQACGAGLQCDHASKMCWVAQGGACGSVCNLAQNTCMPESCANGLGCVASVCTYGGGGSNPCAGEPDGTSVGTCTCCGGLCQNGGTCGGGGGGGGGPPPTCTGTTSCSSAADCPSGWSCDAGCCILESGGGGGGGSGCTYGFCSGGSCSEGFTCDGTCCQPDTQYCGTPGAPCSTGANCCSGSCVPSADFGNVCQ